MVTFRLKMMVFSTCFCIVSGERNMDSRQAQPVLGMWDSWCFVRHLWGEVTFNQVPAVVACNIWCVASCRS